MTYRHEAYIRQAMEGVLMQKTTFPVEVVIGDDFSDDQTLEVIRGFISNSLVRIRILERSKGDAYDRMRKQHGRLYNFADIVSHCEGTYIALLDGDDFWTDPYKLQRQADFLDANPDFVACYHAVSVVDEKGHEVKTSKSSFVHNRDFSAEELRRGRVMSTLSLCFRNVIREFPEEFYRSPTGDNFLCSLLGEYGGGKFLPEIKPSAYRMHATGTWSLTSEDTKRMNLLKSYFWLWQYYDRIGKPDVAKTFYQKILIEGYYSDPLNNEAPSYLRKPERFITRAIRKTFQMIRFMFGTHKKLSPGK